MRKTLAVTLVVAAAGSAVAAGPALSANRSVAVRDNVFSPRSLTARAGDTIVFSWRGDNPHNVRAASGPVRFASDTQSSGRFRVRVRRTGRYRVVCDIHPGMEMALRVRR